MKLENVVLFGSFFSSITFAHYTFSRLIFNNKWAHSWEHVRNVSLASGKEPPIGILYPQTDPTSLDLVCGRNATNAWSKPKTVTLRAGEKVGFAAGELMLPVSDYDTSRTYHHGIASMWLSKAPSGDLNTYHGDGDWFTIFSMLEPIEQSLDWNLPENKICNDAPGQIPTPLRTYLPKPGVSFGAQFYVNCAHVEIVNEGPIVRQPGPVVKIPEVYTFNQPDIYVDTYASDFKFGNMKAPAPEVWKG